MQPHPEVRSANGASTDRGGIRQYSVTHRVVTYFVIARFIPAIHAWITGTGPVMTG